jgi:hypothetical protein
MKLLSTLNHYLQRRKIMKNRLLLISMFVILTLLTACAPAEVAVEEAVLTVGGQGFSQSDLEGLEAMTADYTNKDGETTTYSGVSLSSLLDKAGISGSGTLVFTAADGFQADLPLEEALACANCIVAFDDGSLRMVMPDMSSKLQVKDVIEITVE